MWLESSLLAANRTTFGVGGHRLRVLGRLHRECTSKKLPDSRVRAVAARGAFVRFIVNFWGLFGTDEGAIRGAEERHGVRLFGGWHLNRILIPPTSFRSLYFFQLFISTVPHPTNRFLHLSTLPLSPFLTSPSSNRIVQLWLTPQRKRSISV